MKKYGLKPNMWVYIRVEDGVIIISKVNEKKDQKTGNLKKLFGTLKIKKPIQ